MNCARAQELIPILRDLAADDPDRAAALRHVRACVRCAAHQRETDQILDELDRLPPPEPPSPASLRRSFEAIDSRIRAGALEVTRWSVAGGLLVVTALGALALRRAPAEGILVATLVAAAVAAAAVAVVGFVRAAWAAGIAVTASAGIALLVGRPGAEIHLAAGLGGCALVETVAGLAVAVAGVGAAWAARLRPDRYLGASLAAAGALAAQGVLLLRCPGREHGHLFLFHVGAVLVATGMGAVVGRLLERPR